MARFNPLVFDPLPYVRGQEVTPEVLEENSQRLARVLRTLGNGLESLAYILGGQLLEDQALTVSTSSSGDDDVVIPHGLGRVPRAIALSLDDDGLGGMAMGAPGGSIGAQGGNELPWTATEIRVRASRAASYQIIII